jgi:hypothetical protein
MDPYPFKVYVSFKIIPTSETKCEHSKSAMPLSMKKTKKHTIVGIC